MTLSTPLVAPIPIVAPPQPSSAALAQARGGALNPALRPHPPLPPSAAPASAMAPPTVTAATGEAAADTGGIRLMSLGPRAQGQSMGAVSAGAHQTGGGMAPTDDEQPPPPIISGLGQGQIQGPDVPVGAIAGFLVMSPGGDWTIDPATIQWSGGTDYKSYFSDDASSKVSGTPSLRSVSLVTGVSTGDEGYSFIVDATPRQY
ncbi:MAG: hypothetical protein IRY99_18125, partial [Isosphaeraceae bacterium]|nr:hypothetical protein [Isosphaeraceae bacterium]